MFGLRGWQLLVMKLFLAALASTTPIVADIPPVEMKFSGGSPYYIEGETFTIKCAIKFHPVHACFTNWTYPASDKVKINTNAYVENFKIVFQNNITVTKATKENAGNYTCTRIKKDGNFSLSIQKIMVEPFIELKGSDDDSNNRYLVVDSYEGIMLRLKFLMRSHPAADISYLKDSYDITHNDQFIKEVKADNESYILTIPKSKVNNTGNYTLYASNGYLNSSFTYICTVHARRPLKFQEPITESTIVEVYEFLSVSLTCTSDAVPPPKLVWFKVKEENFMSNFSDEVIIRDEQLNYGSVESKLYIEHMEEKHIGKYECVAKNSEQSSSRYFDLRIKEKRPFVTALISSILVILVLLILLVMYLSWRIRNEKMIRKELSAVGLLYFAEGAPESINPDLRIDEQVELLPYDPKFEFPVEKLVLGKQLGAGAFGVVYKAEARGILNAEETTACAVKMVKKTADNMYIKALASELKIMVHLGKHINIVNLLGACTKKIWKRELLVIVEYCKFGCIHTYLQTHRQVFIDQLSENEISRNANNGLRSDLRWYTNVTRDPKPTKKVSKTGYIQPEWRSNYESDYSYNGCSPTPLCSRDLLCWAFQIARGMEYLASRKILHGDLAARNILLAEDNVVKICDFGLARSIYKNDEYLKKENSPVPIKWLAIECLVDSIFSTQSDVWAFGVVLWELFSLGQTPYPNINLRDIRQWLVSGNRLEKPRYADDQLYKLMMRCWDVMPKNRPSFAELQETLGAFLDEKVRKHYVDLNSPYDEINAANRAGGVEDYLTMVSSPDYNHIVLPNLNQYVSKVNSFYSSLAVQLQHDDEGYLQMSPARNQAVFSSPPQDKQFDIDSRKLSSRIHTPTSSQSEITTMLTQNMSTSGSESYYDSNTSPYLKMRRMNEKKE